MKKYLIALLMLKVLSTSAQETYEDKLGAWYTLQTTNTITKNVSLTAGAQQWTYETVSNFNLLLVYVCTNYNFNNHWSATLGYGNINWDTTFESTDTPNIKENRVYEQLCYKSSLKKFTLQNRLRLEHRFLNNNGLNTTQNRVRYCFKVKYPLNKTFFVTAYEELILNTKNDLFQQNRLYGALGIKASKNCSFQLGYLQNDFTTKSLHRLQLGLYITTDLRHI